MKLIKYLFVLMSLLGGLSAYGQEMRVTGTVYDSTGTKPLPKATAMAIRVRDSLLLGFTRTNQAGEFSLRGFEVDTFSLIIEHPSYDEKVYYMFGHADNYEINIQSIRMPFKSQELEEVVIYAFKDPIYYKGDTLVYVADSFKVGENAVVEDLLKKLPGIEVDKDGKIKSQGQDIGKVLVDGDEFFGSDPTIATKNLGAKSIESVQIYEKKNEDGGDSDEKIQVLDLKLKEDAKKGYFGRISGASDMTVTPIEGKSGTDPFYEGELLLNHFNHKQKISLFALGTNTPKSAFGWGDMNKFGLDNESGAGRNFWEFSDMTSSGIPQTFKSGIYYSDKIGKKTDIGFNYSYYNTTLDSRSASRSQYFLSDTTYFTDDSTRNYTKNESHNFNLKFKSQLDSLTTLEIKPSLAIDKGITKRSDISMFMGEDMAQSLDTKVQNDNDSKGYSLNSEVKFNRKFMKKKRELELMYYLTLTENETDGSLKSTSNFTAGAGVNDTIDQLKDFDNYARYHHSTIRYTEPIGKKFKLEFEYLYEYDFSEQLKTTYDGQNGLYNDFREDLSNSFETVRQQNRMGTKLIFETRKHSVSGGLRLRNIDINNRNLITTTTISQNINNLLPNFRYEYKPSVSKRFMVFYDARSSQPSINDLQPVPDNSNPNRIQKGNPDLKPNYTHNMRLNFNTWKAITGQYFWSGGFVNITNDAFASSVSYDTYGRTIAQTINVDGNVSSSVWAGGGFPIYKKIIKLEPQLDGSFNRYTNFIENQENITDNLAFGGGLDVKFTWDSLEFSVGNNFNQNIAQSSLSSVSNSRFSTQKYMADFEWRLKRGIAFEMDAEYTINGQRTEGYNINFFVLNAELSKSFLKTENLRVAIIGNDLFNQNVNAQRQVSGNVITDNRTRIISRYFLLKMTLRFNSNKTKEDDFKGWH